MRLALRVVAVVLALLGSYWVVAHALMVRWGATFAEFEGQPRPSVSEQVVQWLVWGVPGFVAVGLALYVWLRARRSGDIANP